MHRLFLASSFAATSSRTLIVSPFRYGVSIKTVAGEPESVAKEMTAPWTETTLPTIFSRYALIDFFNADEFGLFYQSLPSKNHAF